MNAAEWTILLSVLLATLVTCRKKICDPYTRVCHAIPAGWPAAKKLQKEKETSENGTPATSPHHSSMPNSNGGMVHRGMGGMASPHSPPHPSPHGGGHSGMGGMGAAHSGMGGMGAAHSGMGGMGAAHSGMGGMGAAHSGMGGMGAAHSGMGGMGAAPTPSGAHSLANGSMGGMGGMGGGMSGIARRLGSSMPQSTGQANGAGGQSSPMSMPGGMSPMMQPSPQMTPQQMTPQQMMYQRMMYQQMMQQQMMAQQMMAQRMMAQRMMAQPYYPGMMPQMGGGMFQSPNQGINPLVPLVPIPGFGYMQPSYTIVEEPGKKGQVFDLSFGVEEPEAMEVPKNNLIPDILTGVGHIVAASVVTTVPPMTDD